MVGHVAPEASRGGPIAAVRDGDTIELDVEARELRVLLPDDEIAGRLAPSSRRRRGTRRGPRALRRRCLLRLRRSRPAVAISCISVAAHGERARPAPHRERLRDRPCDASATSPREAHGAKPGRMCRANERRIHPVPATSLRCRVCETEHPLEADRHLPKCFGPLDPVYDRDALRGDGHPRARSRPGRRRSGATPTCSLSPRPQSRGSPRASRRSSARRASPRSSASASSG